MRIEEIALYSYDELSETAQERVRDWVHALEWSDGAAHDRMGDVALNFLEDRGWTGVGDLTYRLYVQGGMPKWSGETAVEHDGLTYAVTVARDGHITLDHEGEHVPWWVEGWRGKWELSGPAKAARAKVDVDALGLLYALRDEDEFLGSDEFARETLGDRELFTEDGRPG